MARRQGGELDTPDGEERVATDEESVGPLARKAVKGCMDFAAGADLEDLDL
jgi:hypothetical protein